MSEPDPQPEHSDDRPSPDSQRPTQRLWEYAVERYDRAGASAALINFQDKFHANINVILWCCWRAEQSTLLSDIEMRHALDIANSWAREISSPLRTARRALGTERYRNHARENGGLYDKVKAIELESERLELALYEAIGNVTDAKPSQGSHQSLARRNIASYCALAGLVRSEEFSVSLIDDIVQLICDDNQSADELPRKDAHLP